MAYLDATNPQRNLGTFAVVAALEAGLALALIAGLSYSYTRARDAVLITTNVPLPPPPEPVIDEPRPAPDTPRAIERPVAIDDPVILGPAPIPSYVPAATGGEDDGIGTVAFPTPSPVPSFTAVKATPRGNPANWVTENDYPTSEIRLEHEGRTGFRLSLDATGKVTACTVTSSSGWPVLDATACEKLARRAKFDPAIDNSGARTEGFYVGSVNWRLPEV